MNEKYEIIQPTVSTHNIVIGTMYNDIGGKSIIRSLTNKNLKCELKYTKRGWFATENYKVEGDVTSYENNSKKGSPLFRIHGNWNSKVYISPYVNGKPDETAKHCVFAKNEQPENSDFMYGLSHHAL